MLQAENAFGTFTSTPDELRSPVLHAHGVTTIAGWARLAFTKDFYRFRLQTFNERRFCVIENPELEFRNFRQRCQFLQMRD